MGLNNITFVKGKGGLGRPLAGKDHISGLLFYTGTLPSGFSSSNRIKNVFSVEEAEDLGIKNDYNDETQATGVYTVSAIGANGDTVNVSIVEPTKTVDLGTYTKTATETTVTLVASAIVALINSGTLTHGYSASNTAGAITITFRKGLGIFPNIGTPLVVTTVGTISGSITTAVTGGVASKQAVYHYHISEYFRVQPKGNLFLGFYAIPSTYTFEEIETMQTYANVNGAIRQIGVYADGVNFATSQTTTLQAVANNLDVLKMPLSVIYASNITSGTNITSLADLNTLSNYKVSVVISQDNGGLGRDLFKATGKSITTLGATLGAVSLASVSEDIAWVGKFNLSNGIELESIGFCNGESGLSQNALSGLNDKRYIFLRKFPNLAGTFFNDSHTAVSVASDYAYIENNRVIDKAIRGVDEALLPSLNSPLRLNSDGTLANSTIVYLESQAVVITDNMVRNAEASAISVSINPSQNVASTSEVVATIDIVPIGVARNIVVNIGFKTSL
jgi:hypothetical protein